MMPEGVLIGGKIITSPGTGERKIKTGEFLGVMLLTSNRGCVRVGVGWW